MAQDNIKTTVEELHKLINIKNYVGEAIETDNAILIPVMRAGLGFGAGGNLTGEEGSDAAAAGAGVEPVSMVVVTKGVEGVEAIRVLNLTKGNDVNKAISDLGLVISDIVKELIPKKDDDDDDHDEGEYIPPEYGDEIEVDGN
ncbi:sporulation protein [Methanobrevibacter sp. OttesenSCG-928-K11]|nr:sporulation protein [Methanobrevibacter sp. OttesenSCG-928-K11]MDL2270237.1 sporulation protein [Methanobrevibacter sp. OttesenSCG-928-I08]